jgi:hypothetical protein
MVGRFGGASLSAFLHVGRLMSGLDSSFSMRLLQTTGLFLALLTGSAAGVRAADANDTDTEIGADGATGLGDPVIPNVPAGPGGPARAVATASSICHAFHQKPGETCVLDDRKFAIVGLGELCA